MARLAVAMSGGVDSAVAAALLVGSYAVGVFGYVLATPEIGIRCAFSPVVNRFYPEFLYPEQQEPLKEGDIIVHQNRFREGSPVECIQLVQL